MYDIRRNNQGPEAVGGVPWSAYFAIEKRYTGANGNTVVEGPLSNPSKDLQGETMNMHGLWEGLKVFDKFNRPVDLDHLFERTRDPRYLIGKGVERFVAPHPHTGLDVPWLRTELFWNGEKGKPLAKATVEHLEVGGSMGYSVAGLAGSRDPNDRSKIVTPIITSVALTPVPVVSENAGCVQLLKGFQAILHGEEIHLPVVPETLELVRPLFAKAMEVTPGLPHVGKTGAGALATEDATGTAIPLRFYDTAQMGAPTPRGRRRNKKGIPLRKSITEMNERERLALMLAAQLAEAFGRR